MNQHICKRAHYCNVREGCSIDKPHAHPEGHCPEAVSPFCKTDKGHSPCVELIPCTLGSLIREVLGNTRPGSLLGQIMHAASCIFVVRLPPDMPLLDGVEFRKWFRANKDSTEVLQSVYIPTEG